MLKFHDSPINRLIVFRLLSSSIEASASSNILVFLLSFFFCLVFISNFLSLSFFLVLFNVLIILFYHQYHSLPCPTSPCHALPYPTSPHMTLLYITLPYHTLPYPALSYLTPPCLASPSSPLHYHTLFCLVLPLQDYEAASQMYKLAKEDFKSDKSTTHLAHATLMAAICHLITGMYTFITTTYIQLFFGGKGE